ncbi:MAG TPA: uroporphyrinogen-III C-methyltransferase [Candidatus Sulfopaludibacter sp.]|nr:uroporphyrinogen-III C-methyltransferase [Candidatus Sulfopaludibacter sp.]
MKSKGAVYLVGAGPGDAGLLTLRGAELLRRADVVLYDSLVNPELLRFTRPGAELISRGKHMKMPQEEITALVIDRARVGKCVVRLKGGDPYIFGRGGEEAEALAAADVPFEIVPGVSSIVAAPNYAGIPLTHREHCSSFTVFTGHSDSADAATALRYEQIAKIPGTKVVLMGTDNLDDWTKSLIAQGMSPATPAAIVQWGTLGKQKSAAGTLATIAALAAKEKIVPPALTIVGDVVKLREKLNWFEQRPLFGQRIVVTRPRGRDAVSAYPHFGDGGTPSFPTRLAELGAEVLEIPAIKTIPTNDKQDVVDVLLGLNSYDWLVFTSVNGVTAFFDLFFKRFQDLRDLGGARIAAVGPATAAKLRELHLQVDLTPEEALGAKIAKVFAENESVENLKICLLRASEANPDLPRELETLGAIVDDIAIYRTVAETEDRSGAGADLLENGADWITFTSGSTVEHFHARFDLPNLLKKFPQTKLASIGPETSKAIRALGLAPTLEAKEHTTDGLIAELLRGTRPGKTLK